MKFTNYLKTLRFQSFPTGLIVRSMTFAWLWRQHLSRNREPAPIDSAGISHSRKQGRVSLDIIIWHPINCWNHVNKAEYVPIYGENTKCFQYMERILNVKKKISRMLLMMMILIISSNITVVMIIITIVVFIIIATVIIVNICVVVTITMPII